MKLTGSGKMMERANWVSQNFLPKVMPGENVLRLRMLLIPRMMENVIGLNTLTVLMPMTLSLRSSRKG